MNMKIVIFLSLIFVCGNVFSAQSQTPNLKRKYVPGEILVRYKSSLSSLDQKYAIEREGGQRIASLKKKGWNRVRLKKTLDMNEAIAEFKQDPDVIHAQPNFIYHSLAIPNDPRFGQLWGLRNTGQTISSVGGPDSPTSTNNPGVSGRDMNIQYAWNTITDCSSVTVGVLDSGINYNHADLSANMWNGGSSYPNHGYNFIDNNNDPMDKNGHGSHVAGTIGAVGNNGVGSTGVCWNVKLMAVKVLGNDGYGTTASIIDGIYFAVDNGAKVINMSLGGGDFDQLTSDAITYALTNGVLVVAAAGNDGTNNDSSASYPCNYAQANIVCVAALTQNYSLASFSNYGLTSVDVGAPGVNIVSEWPGTHATTIVDAMNAGWNFYSSTGSGWAYKSLNFGSPVACLVNPTNYNYTSAKYSNNMDARAWKSFNLGSSYDAAILKFYMMVDVEPNDSISIHAKTGSSDPIPGGTTLDAFAGSTDGSRIDFTYDITPFLGGAFSVGYNLVTDSSVVDFGVNVSELEIETLVLNTTSYNVISGTSMATPHVAGLAAMLFAYNPNYTYADVASSIKNGGTAVAALSGKTTTGKAASAIGSLNYINAPTGGVAVKLP